MQGKDINSENLSKRFSAIYRRSIKYRDFILLSEIGALLHDLGKLSKFFVISKARVPTAGTSKPKSTLVKDFHGQILFIDYEKMPQSIKEFIFAPFWMFFEGKNELPGKNTQEFSAFKAFKEMFHKDPLSVYSSSVKNSPEIKNIPLNISIGHLVCAHHGCSRCLLENYIHKKCVFSDSMPGSPLRIDKHPLMKLLKTVDHLDASNPSNAGKQEMFSLYRDDFFFGETKLPLEQFDEMRAYFYKESDNFLCSLNGCYSNFYAGKIPEINRFINSIAGKYFTSALSETRRSGNDITLLDHSKAVAAFFKTFLYFYLVMGKEVPDSFFDVRFRILQISKTKHSARVRNFLEKEIACCNEIAETDNYQYFLVPFIKQNGVFMRFLRNTISENVLYGEKAELLLLKVNDFTEMFEDTLCGKMLSDILKKFSVLKVKNYSDIANGYTEEQAIKDVKRVVYFALLRKKELLLTKLKSSKKHLNNLYNGSIYNEKNLVKYFRKEREVKLLEKHLNAFVSMEHVKEIYGWNSSKDAEGAVYNFFNTVLSPVRPPSPVDMSFYFLKQFNKLHSFKKLTEQFLIRRPLVLGRVLALFRTLETEFCKKKKND